MQIPRATYRLQFNEGFRLQDALALVPYLHALGVSHIYASPIFKAAPHSSHGYDVCDFSRLNPEIGSESDLERLVNALHEKGMGLVLDMVPNHMGIASPENKWWWDLLKNGCTSNFAGHFDVNWKSSDPKVRGKILIPILGDSYENVLAKGGLKIENENGELILSCFEYKLPLARNSTATKNSITAVFFPSTRSPASVSRTKKSSTTSMRCSGDGSAAAGLTACV